MTISALKAWDEAPAVSWGIEKPVAKPAGAPFFPDQNGGVYEKLLSNLPVMLHCMDGSGRMISANLAWCEALGYQPQDVVGRAFSEFLPPESRSKLVTEIYPKFLVGSTYRNAEILIHRKDGSLATVIMSMTAYRGDKGRLERSVCYLEDITQRKIAALTSNRGDQRFRGAFNAAASGMVVVSPSGQIELANTAICEMLGRPTLNSAAFSFEELIHSQDRSAFLNGMRQLLMGQLPVLKQDIRYLCGDGRILDGATSIALVKNEKDETEQLIVQIIDQSARKGMDQRMQRAQKMEAIGQLTGGLAHDFNNLLTVIIGNLQLLDGKIGVDEKSAKRIAEAIDAAKKGSDLTHQLLAIARKQDLEPRDVSVNTLVGGMEQLVKRTLGENIEVKVDLMAGEPHALIDPSQLESAILNLAINARDAMAQGGRLTIETQPVFLDHEYAEKNPDVATGNYVMVAVTDTGSGMGPELLEKIFQPFFTTKPQGQGTGLGLSMVYGFIKQSGGHVSVYSEVGHGTSFKMYLPRRMRVGEAVEGTTLRSVAEVVAQTIEAPVAVHPARKPKLLVVEDQAAVRAVACGFLEDFGYDVVEAGDGFEALAKLHETPDIDLMFTDVVMPGGMNGFDLAQAAQSLRPDLKIVHTSGYPKGAMVHQDEPRFKNGFIIMKPYRREELQKIIKNALEQQS